MGLFNKYNYYFIPISDVTKTIWDLSGAASSSPKRLETKTLSDFGYFNAVGEGFEFLVIKVDKDSCEEVVSGIKFSKCESFGNITYISDGYDKVLVNRGVLGNISIVINGKPVSKSDVEGFLRMLRFNTNNVLERYREALKKVFGPSEEANELIEGSKKLTKTNKKV